MNADYEKELGHNIRMLREKRNLTQEQLSAKLQIRNCDITRSALAKIEVGQRHLYVDEVFHLKNILKVSEPLYYDEIFPDKCNGYEE